MPFGVRWDPEQHLVRRHVTDVAKQDQLSHTSRFFISWASSSTNLVPRVLSRTACFRGWSKRMVAAAWKTIDTRSASSWRLAVDRPRSVIDTSPEIPTNLRLRVAPSISVFSLSNNWKEGADIMFKMLRWIKSFARTLGNRLHLAYNLSSRGIFLSYK